MRQLVDNADTCPWKAKDKPIRKYTKKNGRAARPDPIDQSYYEVSCSYGLTISCGTGWSVGDSNDVLWVQASTYLRLHNEQRMQFDLMQWFDKALQLKGDDRSQVGGDSGSESSTCRRRIEHDDVYCKEGHPGEDECNEFPYCRDCSLRACTSGDEDHCNYQSRSSHNHTCPSCEEQLQLNESNSDTE